MKRKIMAVLSSAALVGVSLFGLSGTATASSHIVWVDNPYGGQCHVVGEKSGRTNTVYSAGTSNSCVYGRAQSAYYVGSTLKYVTGNYLVTRSVATVGPAYGVASYQAAGGPAITHGGWKAY